MLDIGDEVICVNDSRPEGWSSEVFPEWVVKDQKYIVRELLNNDNIVVGVLVNELHNPIIWQPLIGRYQEGAFAIWRFEKLRTAYQIQEEKSYKQIVKEITEPTN